MRVIGDQPLHPGPERRRPGWRLVAVAVVVILPAPNFRFPVEIVVFDVQSLVRPVTVVVERVVVRQPVELQRYYPEAVRTPAVHAVVPGRGANGRTEALVVGGGK